MCFSTNFVAIFLKVSSAIEIVIPRELLHGFNYARATTVSYPVSRFHSQFRETKQIVRSTSTEDNVTINNLIVILHSLRFIVVPGEFVRSLSSNMRLGASIQPAARESDFRRKRDERKRDRDDGKKKTTREEKDRTWFNCSASESTNER